MSILSGYGKYKRYILTSEGYKLCSQWTSSNTVEMGDGNTAETNLGSIKGITDSLTATSSNIALSASAGNNLQTQVDTLNSNIQCGNMPLIKTGTTKRTEGGMDIYVSETYTIRFDRPFKSNNVFIVTSECGGNLSRFYQYRYISVSKNGFIVQLFANYPNYDPPAGMWIAIGK